jgi:outer membrane receptor protein involved in Fe transport
MIGERLGHDVSLSWRYSSKLTFFLSGRNIFNQLERTYLGPNRSDLKTGHLDYGTFWNVGVRGQF